MITIDMNVEVLSTSELKNIDGGIIVPLVILMFAAGVATVCLLM